MSRALLSPEHAGRLLEEIIYARVLEVVDLEGLWQLEQLLAIELGELGDVSRDDAHDLAKAMVDRAWHRLADDPRRYIDYSVTELPFGPT